MKHKKRPASIKCPYCDRPDIMSRRNAYCWMRDRFGLSSEQAHIGCFSDYMCDALMAECRAVLENNQIAC